MGTPPPTTRAVNLLIVGELLKLKRGINAKRCGGFEKPRAIFAHLKFEAAFRRHMPLGRRDFGPSQATLFTGNAGRVPESAAKI